MATVVEEYTTEEQCCVARFIWAKRLNSKDVHKEMLSVYGGKCLSRKAVYNWVENFSEGGSKVAYDARSGAEVAGIKFKILLCCGVRRTGKAMGQVYQCWSRNKDFLFPVSNITCFTFYIHLWPIC
jgi:transposase